MHIQPFFDADTATVTYIVSDPATSRCAIIDSVRDYDMNSGRVTTRSADKLIEYITSNKLHVDWILETHIHADHLTAATYLQEKLGGKIGIGENIRAVLSYWIPVFNTSTDTPMDGSQFDALFADGEHFKIGNLDVKVIHTPGHTPACVSYHINNAVFVGDLIFMPYVGTARTDFPGGSAQTSYRSIQKILALPGDTHIFSCHDYPPTGQPPAWESTVAEQKQKNIMLQVDTEEAFVAARNKKDEGKPVPKLLLPSLQVNMRAGKFGLPETNGKQYIKIPLDIA